MNGLFINRQKILPETPRILQDADVIGIGAIIPEHPDDFVFNLFKVDAEREKKSKEKQQAPI